MSREKSTIDRIGWASPSVESMVAIHSPKVRSQNFQKKRNFSEFLDLREWKLSEAMIRYTAAFVDLATPELVRGHFKYRTFYTLDSRAKQLEKTEGNQGLMIDEDEFPHELHHALVALALSL